MSKKYKLTRSVRIDEIKNEGVTFRVTYTGVVWVGHCHFETEHTGMSWGNGPVITFHSYPFKNEEEARVWINRLTMEVTRKASEILPLMQLFKHLEGDLTLSETEVH